MRQFIVFVFCLTAVGFARAGGRRAAQANKTALAENAYGALDKLAAAEGKPITDVCPAGSYARRTAVVSSAGPLYTYACVSRANGRPLAPEERMGLTRAGRRDCAPEVHLCPGSFIGDGWFQWEVVNFKLCQAGYVAVPQSSIFRTDSFAKDVNLQNSAYFQKNCLEPCLSAINACRVCPAGTIAARSTDLRHRAYDCIKPPA